MASYAIFFSSWSYTFSRQTIFRMNKDSVCVQGPKHCVQSLTDIVVLWSLNPERWEMILLNMVTFREQKGRKRRRVWERTMDPVKNFYQGSNRHYQIWSNVATFWLHHPPLIGARCIMTCQNKGRVPEVLVMLWFNVVTGKNLELHREGLSA